MSIRQLSATCILTLLGLVPLVKGHGQINRVVANSVSNTGPNVCLLAPKIKTVINLHSLQIYYSADSINSKTVTRVMYKASGPSYVLPSGFSDNS